MNAHANSPKPVYAPSAISARGGKFKFIPGEPGYVTVSNLLLSLCYWSQKQPTEIDDPTKILDLFEQGAINAKEAGFDGVESIYILSLSLT